MVHRILEIFSAWNKRPPFQICKCSLVGRNHSSACPAFDGHVAHGHAAFHGQSANSFARIFEDVARAPGNSNLADDRQNEIFRCHAARPLAVNFNFHRLGFELRQTLGGEHVLNFASADSKRERAECAVRGRVAVAANNCLSRLRDAKLRPDDVNDPLILTVQVEKMHAVLLAIARERFELAQCVRVENREQAVLRGNRMVHHRKGKLRLANFAPRGFQSRKGLRRSAFVDQVTVNVNQSGLPGFFPDNVCFPNFFVESASCHTVGFPPAGQFPEPKAQSAIAQPFLL